MRWAPALLLCLLATGTLVLPSQAQAPPQPVPIPDGGPVARLVDEVGGTVVVPALNTTYAALGQNLTREDVRIMVELNMTKGTVGIGGLVLGAGTIEVQMVAHARVELRVIAVDRIRQAVEGSGLNLTMGNLSFLESAYLPAEAFRASLAAEAAAAFQAAEEAFLRDYLAASLPELQVLALDVRWSNTLPTEGLTDTSLSEPPIVVELDMTAQYLRVESLPSLMDAYLRSAADPRKQGRDAVIDQIKAEGSEARAKRDFLGAAAYDQLLNLSMAPGWSLDIAIHVPEGYEFTYLSDESGQVSARSVNLHVDALSSDDRVHEVFVASITQPRAVALALLCALLLSGLVLSAPGRLAYARWRLPRLARKAAPPAPKERRLAPSRAKAGAEIPNLVRDARAAVPAEAPGPEGHAKPAVKTP